MSEQPAPQKCFSWSREDPDQQKLSAILSNFKMDNQGFISLGKDGILRSLTAERDTIDAAPLSPSLIVALHSRVPEDYINAAEWDGVDGFKTPESAWYNPDKSLLPKPLSEMEPLKKQKPQPSGDQRED
ncbi:hypothetical protein F5Y16DRAFT_384478 [Xylariaceae sp. FL0255]|nr:hypothetical protein F5Y16DRAFT_384478 [Xylariaceae sp. FL0255]